MENKNMERVKFGLYGLVITLIFSVCTTTATASSPAEDRQEYLAMKNKTLSDLYKVRLGVKAEIAKAPGYAVFSNANINLIFASFGGGYGVVQPKGAKPVYMRMGEIGIGFGLGVKDFRAVFVFHDKATMKNFIDSGWEFGAQADAAAKASDKGAAVGGEVVIDGITIYQLTEAGLALQATVKGTKFWKNDKLN
jgi:lipid-binding SYLF domain-containing protein